LIWLVVAAILIARFGGAHLHLCFDGLEPAAAVHVADGAGHDLHHEDAEHVDQDVALFDVVIVKKSESSSDATMAFIAVLLCLVPIVAPRAPLRTLFEPAFARAPFHLRPPLRGPPC